MSRTSRGRRTSTCPPTPPPTTPSSGTFASAASPLTTTTTYILRCIALHHYDQHRAPAAHARDSRAQLPSSTTTNIELPRRTPGTLALTMPPLSTTTTTTYIPRYPGRSPRHHRLPRRSPPHVPRRNARNVRLGAAVRPAAHHHHERLPRRRRPPRRSPPPPLPPLPPVAHRRPARSPRRRRPLRRSPPPPPPLPSAMPSPRQLRQWAAKLQGLLHAPASRPDPRGYAYVFATTVRLNRRCRRALKFGRTRQRWLYAYRVPHARQFKAIIQLHLKIHGAWLGRVPCEHCPKAHIEKFCWAACGGPQGLRDIIEHYLRLLNWPIRRVRIRAYI
ncbi:hypothetical protein C8J57DRAFT_1537014 [Mycena rebaudengoi]|nr:hypothetical protein C8J57DRAFT_1537014 [Mycena rebaudengoi]